MHESDTELAEPVKVSTPLEALRRDRGFTYAQLATALGWTYHVARRVARGDTPPDPDRIAEMASVYGASVGVDAWERFTPYTTRTRVRPKIKSVSSRYRLPSKSTIDSSGLLGSGYLDPPGQDSRRCTVTLGMDQLTLLDYICGLSGISRTQAIRRLLNFSRRALAEYGTTLITAPEALGRDYFVRPDSQPPSEFPPVGSSDWAAKCEEELEEFNASLAKRREEEEAVVLDGVAESSGVALIRGGSSSLVAESPPDISSWAPHVLSFDSDNSPEDS